MSDAAPLLAGLGVGRRFGSRAALRPVDFAVAAGESVALVGPNGAGKSTLLSILAGALAPSEGRVERAAGVRVGWVPQRPASYARLTARENLELFARLEHVRDPRAAAARLAQAFELPAETRAAELSVGNRQRLNVALAFLGDPSVLLLDEPSASLDPGQRRRVWEHASALKDRGGAVVFATQNLEELDHFADRVAVLLDGAIVFDGSRAEYERAPAADVFA